MKSHLALVYSRGRVCGGNEGVMYDGPPPKVVSIRGCSTLDSIRSKIHARLKLSSNEMVTTVVYRFPFSEKHYKAFELVDDEDLSCAVQAYEAHTNTAMELYIDIQEAEISVRPIEEYVRICDNVGPSIGANMGESQHNSGKKRIESGSSRIRGDDVGYGTPDVNIKTKYVPFFNSSVADISPLESQHVPGDIDMGDDENIADEGNVIMDSEFICSRIMRMIKVEQDVPIALIQERIDSNFGYKVSYRKAWKAKQKAIVRVYGDWNQSYEVLPQFMDMLEYYDQAIYKLECDPFVIVNHRVDNSKRVFNRLFWAFKPCVASFPYCKQFIQVDSTDLYGKHKGVLLIAATQDGNRCPVPLAFAIVEKENNDNWRWFLGLLRIHITQAQGICLISDRHHSIIHSVANENLGWQPPHAYHCFCIRHIGSNVMKDCKDENVRNFVIKIAYEPSQSKVQAKLKNLRSMNEEIHKKMTDIPLEQWCLAYDKGRRYGHMTTNIVECINDMFKGVRKLPITGLVQNTFYRCVKYWVDRASKTQAEIAAGFRYTSKFRKEIDAIQSQASSYYVRSFNRQRAHFEVVEGHDPMIGENGKVVQVLLHPRHCDCGRFQALRYPCSHVVAACASCNISWDPYVDDVYKLKTVQKCYEQEWWPPGDFTKWHNMVGAPIVVPNPGRLRKKGKPKSTRIRS